MTKRDHACNCRRRLCPAHETIWLHLPLSGLEQMSLRLDWSQVTLAAVTSVENISGDMDWTEICIDWNSREVFVRFQSYPRVTNSEPIIVFKSVSGREIPEISINATFTRFRERSDKKVLSHLISGQVLITARRKSRLNHFQKKKKNTLTLVAYTSKKKEAIGLGQKSLFQRAKHV